MLVYQALYLLFHLPSLHIYSGMQLPVEGITASSNRTEDLKGKIRTE